MKIKYYNLKKIIKICPQKWKCVNFLVRDVFKCRLVNFSVRVCVCVLALKWLVFLSIWFRHRQKKEMNGEGGKTRGSIFTKRAVWANLSRSDSRYDEHEPEWTWSWRPRDDEGETFFLIFFCGGRKEQYRRLVLGLHRRIAGSRDLKFESLGHKAGPNAHLNTRSREKESLLEIFRKNYSRSAVDSNNGRRKKKKVTRRACVRIVCLLLRLSFVRWEQFVKPVTASRRPYSRRLS